MQASSVKVWMALPLLWAAPAFAQGDVPSQPQQQPPSGMHEGKETQKAEKAVKLDHGEKKFFDDAASTNLLQIELGKVAMEKGVSPQVKEFGKKMVDEYTRANDDLRRIADAKGLTFPSQMNRGERRVYDKVSKQEGDKFDKAYLNEMVKLHDGDLKAYDKEAKKGKDADLKEFATRQLPTMRQDRETASRDVKQM
jgi:putative membrane protein